MERRRREGMKSSITEIDAESKEGRMMMIVIIIPMMIIVEGKKRKGNDLKSEKERQ